MAKWGQHLLALIVRSTVQIPAGTQVSQPSCSRSMDQYNRSCPPLGMAETKLQRRGGNRNRHEIGLQRSGRRKNLSLL